MSDCDIKVIFENITAQSGLDRVCETSRDTSETCFRDVNECDYILSQKAQRIKSAANAYLEKRFSILQSTGDEPKAKKHLKQLKIRNFNTKYRVSKHIKLIKSVSQSTRTLNIALKEPTVVGNHKPATTQQPTVPHTSNTSSNSDFPNAVKLSPQLSKQPNKFSISGSPLMNKRNKKIFSPEKSHNKSSPEHSFKDLSPLTFISKKVSTELVSTSEENCINNSKCVKRKLNFSSDCSKYDLLGSQNVSNTASPSQSYEDVYLLYQFKLHIDLVMKDDHYRGLFSEEEKEIVETFLCLCSPCKEFYVRMHNRKHKWNRLSEEKYDVATLENVNKLVEVGFFSSDLSNLEVAKMVDLLKVTELKELCKSLSLRCKVKNKKSMIEEIMLFSEKQRTLQISSFMSSSKNMVKERMIRMVGPCFILTSLPRKLFRRIHLLFNLKFNKNEKSTFDSEGLFKIQYAGTNTALYPQYKVDRTAKIFSSREELLRYEEADSLQNEFLEAMDAKQFNSCVKILNIVRGNFIAELLDHSDAAAKYPLSLRKFSPGTVYAYTLFKGVDVLKRLKKNEAAVCDLMLLLDQVVYLPYKRPRWYEMLIGIHKTTGAFLQVARNIQKGVADQFNDDVGWYWMSCRCRELLKRKNGVSLEVKQLLKEVSLCPPISSVPVSELKARALEGTRGYKRIFVHEDLASDGKVFSSVEEFVISYFCPSQFLKGTHSENSLAISLFGIVFWDVVYHFVPCAFVSEFQAKPLDLSTGEFYTNRKSIIDEKLIEMEKWTTEEWTVHVETVFNEQKGKASLVHWNYFSSASEVVDLISCIGWSVVLKISERYAKKYHEVRSGFPDLLLWTPGKQNQYKFVEVKGPNDQLGGNQKLWLDFLIKVNANVEVCYVRALGSKEKKIALFEEEEGKEQSFMALGITSE